MMTTRRHFLIKTIAGAAAVIGATYIALPGDEIDQHASDLIFLTRHDQVIVAALLPVLLAGYVDKNRPVHPTLCAKLLHNFDQAVALQRPGVQAELRQLFDLLSFKLSRAALTHSLASWTDLPWQNKQQLLLDWRDSALDLLQTAYSGLHDLVIAAYFVESSSWSEIGYEPPPALRGS